MRFAPRLAGVPAPLPFSPQRALAIGAHPDDVEFHAGGTLRRLVQEGAEVTLLVCSDGGRGGAVGAGEAAAVRRAEQDAAAGLLGVARLVWLGLPDGELAAGDPLRAELALAIRRVRPELVLAHDPHGLWTVVGGIAQPKHSDHRAAGQAAIDACYPRAASPHYHPEQLAEHGLKPWYPRELWLFDTGAPDLRVEIADTLACKLDALRQHASQEAVAGGLVAPARVHAAHWGSEERPAEPFVRLRLY
jgi:LmbE family N-acetylglucosaminyl deacetylase